MPLFTEWIGASSFEVILGGLSSHFPTWATASGTSGSRRVSLILPHERTRRRIRLCQFCTLIHIVTETTMSPLEHCPLAFRFWPQHSSFVNSARYFCQCLQSVTIRSCFLLMNLQVVQFQHGLEFLRLSSCHSNSVLSCADSRVLNLYRLSKISSDAIFDKDSRISSHLVSNSWILSSWRVTENKSAWSNTVSWAPVTRK